VQGNGSKGCKAKQSPKETPACVRAPIKKKARKLPSTKAEKEAEKATKLLETMKRKLAEAEKKEAAAKKAVQKTQCVDDSEDEAETGEDAAAAFEGECDGSSSEEVRTRFVHKFEWQRCAK
jgi:hypothetical protein